MTKERYDQISHFLTARPSLLALVKALTRWLPGTMYAAYPVLLIVLAATHDTRVYRVLLIPAVVFIAVTLVRKVLNCPRPYETLAIVPLLPREGTGQSFPSRHAASAAVIAAAFMYICVPAGLVMSVIALLIAASRPLAGLHFPRDVIAGALFGLVAGILGFWLFS